MQELLLIIAAIGVPIGWLIVIKQQRDSRIDKVVDEYCKGKNYGIPGLVLCGVCELKSEEEIDTVISKIESRGRNIQPYLVQFKDKIKKKFFDYVCNNKIHDLSTDSIEKIMRKVYEF
ncbi:MAG: hypothetical protein Q7K21_04455 [Elusimicrobiota bacterium]|nr:hypothetical protein [Elusimicrobiota bacterium]